MQFCTLYFNKRKFQANSQKCLYLFIWSCSHAALRWIMLCVSLWIFKCSLLNLQKNPMLLSRFSLCRVSNGSLNRLPECIHKIQWFRKWKFLPDHTKPPSDHAIGGAIGNFWNYIYWTATDSRRAQYVTLNKTDQFQSWIICGTSWTTSNLEEFSLAIAQLLRMPGWKEDWNVL